jgi:hypothetical protein
MAGSCHCAAMAADSDPFFLFAQARGSNLLRSKIEHVAFDLKEQARVILLDWSILPIYVVPFEKKNL